MTKLKLVALTAVFCMAASCAAQARTRDDVMSGALRCAAIGESRQWLDCYYGAAQPVRAELGLAPAPAAQIRLAASPTAGMPADSEVRASVMADSFRCDAIAEDRRWLDCYYAAAQLMRSRLGLSPAPQGPVVPAGQVRPAELKGPGPQFGLPQPDTTGLPAGADRVVSRMKSFSFDKYGIFTVTLANGQVWNQISGDTEHAHWKAPAASYVVNISHGWFGSYNFQVRGNPGLYKVRRQS